MEAPRKIVEPPITVPKPRPQMHHQQHNQQHYQQQHHQQQHHQQQHRQQQHNQQQHRQQQHNQQQKTPVKIVPGTSKYADLLHVIEDLGQHIRPTYSGHKGSTEKIKQGIGKARILVKECLIETEKSARQWSQSYLKVLYTESHF